MSLTPVLLAVELGFLAAIAWRGTARAGLVHAYLLWLALYGIVTGVLAARGAFVADALMPWVPGLWLQLVTIAVVVLPVLVFPGLRGAMHEATTAMPWHWFAGFHGLRVLAVGTLYKAWTGVFPAYFAVLVGIPDLLFGLSALWIARVARRGHLSARGFMAWNLAGILVIVPAAPILLQLGLPGPLQVFDGSPDARAVFAWPMSVAPMLGVPLFVLTNLWLVWHLWVRDRAPRDARSARLQVE